MGIWNVPAEASPQVTSAADTFNFMKTVMHIITLKIKYKAQVGLLKFALEEIRDNEARPIINLTSWGSFTYYVINDLAFTPSPPPFRNHGGTPLFLTSRLPILRSHGPTPLSLSH